MKFILICLIYIFIFSSTSYALEGEEKTSQIEMLISKIKTSKASEKRVLINELKIQLRQMNKENRAKVMQELRTSFNANSQSKGINIRQIDRVHNPQKQNKKHNYSQHKAKR